MKIVQSYLKYGAIILACVTLLVVLNRVKGCSPFQDGPQSTTVPPDSSFAPVTRKNYQPPSLPFSKKRLDVRLPRGLEEKDVKRVISLEVSDVPVRPPKKIDIIETVSGEIFIERDSSVQSVSVTQVEPQIVSVAARFGCGFTVSKVNSSLALSPSAVLAPVEWSGWIHAPTIVADLDGVGPGAQLQLYHDLHVGAARLWRYEGETQLKLSLAYMF